MSNTAHLEALLFALGRPLARVEVMQMLSIDHDTSEEAIAALKVQLEGRGISLVDDGVQVELRTAAPASTLIDRIRAEEYSRDIGRAGLETLAAIIYQGPLSRSDIDFIRGVNSAQTLSTLTMRGLVRRVPVSTSGRAGSRGTFVFEPTTELLAQLGITHEREVADYTDIQEKLTQLKEAYQATNKDRA